MCQALQGIRGGQSSTAVIEAVEPRLRPGVQALLFQVLRNLGRADALRGQLVARKPPPAADALLCTALALAWDPQAAPYEPFTLVNQAVEAAKRGQATRGQASFINACLRRFLREREALQQAVAYDLQAQWNHPRWWVQRLQKEHLKDEKRWQQILQANNTQAPMVLRINKRKSTVAQYLRALAAIDFDSALISICIALQGTRRSLRRCIRCCGKSPVWESVACIHNFANFRKVFSFYKRGEDGYSQV